MSTIKENDLREELLEEGWTPLGEIERYSRFGIDFAEENVTFINDFGCLEDNDPKWEIEHQFQKVAVEAAKLYEMLKEYENV